MGKRPYVILANPKSGTLGEYEKSFILAGASGILECEIRGLDTTSKDDFMACARELKRDFLCVVVAGGDGTFSDAINAGENNEATLAYLPLGTGNAIGSALEYHSFKFRDLAGIARKIKDGKDHTIDTILCETTTMAWKGLMAGVGLDGEVIKLSQDHRAAGRSSLSAYSLAMLNAVLGNTQRGTYSIAVDGDVDVVTEMISFVVMKHPFFGYQLKVNPAAKLDSRFLHAIAFAGGLPLISTALLTAAFNGSIFGGNHAGKHYCGDEIHLTTSREMPLQVDGNLVGYDENFQFHVLKRNLRVRY